MEFNKICKYRVGQLAYFLDKMKNTMDGDASLLVSNPLTRTSRPCDRARAPRRAREGPTRAVCTSVFFPSRGLRAPPRSSVRRRRRPLTLSWGCRPLQRLAVPAAYRPVRLRAFPPRACPCGTAPRGFPRPGPPPQREPKRVPLVKFDSPSEFSEVRCLPGLRRFPAGFRSAEQGRLSWGSASLRRSTSGAPFFPTGKSRSQGDGRCHPPAGSALGVSHPLGGFGRGAVRRTRLPEPAAFVTATPRSLAGLFHPASARGIRP